eukprot:TRINITY_DN7945_c0_g2_i1.p2 TRINITY_DN7945_c0_g2~~TRINITY_DN7945_c0_g2_i1.p2  ORF type:complete len:152 (-),score=6.25 TRINITY_DN7945_c0_g2_i1:7-462(-)
MWGSLMDIALARFHGCKTTTIKETRQATAEKNDSRLTPLLTHEFEGDKVSKPIKKAITTSNDPNNHSLTRSSFVPSCDIDHNPCSRVEVNTMLPTMKRNNNAKQSRTDLYNWLLFDRTNAASTATVLKRKVLILYGRVSPDPIARKKAHLR